MKIIFKKSLTILLLSATIFSLNSYALSPTSIEGEKFYIEAKCHTCHNKGDNYDPKKLKVKNFSNLKGWTSSCATHFDIDWFPEDEALVNQYINEIYYDFKH